MTSPHRDELLRLAVALRDAQRAAAAAAERFAQAMFRARVEGRAGAGQPTDDDPALDLELIETIASVAPYGEQVGNTLSLFILTVSTAAQGRQADVQLQVAEALVGGVDGYIRLPGTTQASIEPSLAASTAAARTT